MEQPDSSNKDQGADRPINGRAEDVLRRAKFSIAVAKGIAARTGKESYVIGLYGTWGSGKSSVKNMILEALSEKPDSAPTVVEFNPWQFKDAEQLTQAFFIEIAAKLDEKTGSSAEIDANKQSAAKWKQFGSAMTVGGDAVANIAKVAGFFGVPFAEVARSLGEAVKAAGGEAKEAAASLEAPPVQSLSEIKKELRSAMEGLPHTLLVVIDDIDRLTSSEMALVFQLVKANGDFPNMVYLLLFQRDTVEAGLSEVSPNKSGSDYLDKIVQSGLNLPAIMPSRLIDMMLVELKLIVGEANVRDLSVEVKPGINDMIAGRIGGCFYNALMPYFKTVRDIRRFINTFEFQFDMLCADGVLQANIADLFALEILRSFEPAVYNYIAINSKLFTLHPATVYDQGQSVRERFNIILSLARNQERVTEIIYALFPNIKAVVENQKEGQPNDDAKAKFKVYHPSSFERYFQLSLPEDELPEAEVKEIFLLLPDQAALAEKIVEINERGLLSDLIQRWMFRDELLPDQTAIIQAFLALSEAVDRMPEPPSGAPHYPEMFATKFVLKNGKDSVNDVAFAIDCVRKSSAVYLPGFVLFSIYSSIVNNEFRYYFGRNNIDISAVRDEVVSLFRERMVDAADKIMNHPRRFELLRYWAGVEGEPVQIVIDWLDVHLIDAASITRFFTNYDADGTPRIVDHSSIWQLSFAPVRRAMLHRLEAVRNEDAQPSQREAIEAAKLTLQEAERRETNPMLLDTDILEINHDNEQSTIEDHSDESSAV